jgi:2-dehydro-3-deoxyphosphooctonate aldolase (KDO 8-P synthase)
LKTIQRNNAGGKMQIVQVGDIKIGEGCPLALIAGPCVIESEKIVMDTAERIKTITDRLDMPF